MLKFLKLFSIVSLSFAIFFFVISSSNTFPANAQSSSSSSVAPLFIIGDRIQSTATSLNVRPSPTLAVSAIGAQPSGAQGTIVGGPSTGSGYTWWQIDFDSGVDGWSIESYLKKAVIASPSSTASVTPSPTANLTVNNSHNITLDVGDSVVYVWLGTNGTSYTSSYTSNNSSACGAGGAWLASTASGNSSSVLTSGMAGCLWTVTYSVYNSASGQTATDVVTVSVNTSASPSSTSTASPSSTSTASPSSTSTASPSSTSTASPSATPVDTTAPLILSISSESNSDGSITVTWTTDENSTSLLRYGTVSGAYPLNVGNSTMVKNHKITVTGLTAGSSYHYIVHSADSRGNTVVSPDQGITIGITGWAWSSNIGWISFNSGNGGSGGGPHYVSVDSSTGELDGYAWSSNIGWIKFGGLSGFPAGGGMTTNQGNAKIALNKDIDNTAATINLTTGSDFGKVTGWARACAGTINGDCSSMTSRTDGWDGWIELSGVNHTSPGTGVTYIEVTDSVTPTPSPSGAPNISIKRGYLKGFAWGGDVVGWTDFIYTPGASPSNNICVNGCGSGGGGSSIGCTINPNSNGTNVTVNYGINSDTNQTYVLKRDSTALNSNIQTNGTSPYNSLFTDTNAPQGAHTYSLSRSGGGGASCSVSYTVTPAQTNGIKMWLENSDGTNNEATESITIRKEETAKVHWRKLDLENYTSCLAYVDGSQRLSPPYPDFDTNEKIGTAYGILGLEAGDHTFAMRCSNPTKSRVDGKSASGSLNLKIRIRQSTLEEI